MDQFTFPSKAKRLFMAMMGLGLLFVIIGMATGATGQRLWANALIDGWLFFGAGICGTFFLAVNSAAQAGWGVVLKRVFEAVSMFVPIGAVMILIVLLAAAFDLNHLYHWMHAHGDRIIEGKKAYLNIPFWLSRAVIFLGVYVLFTLAFRRRSLKEDLEGGTTKYFKRNRVLSAGFLVFFGYTSMVASWDWLMSIDPHWFSTMYGWYVFSGMWISGMISVLLTTLWLKKQGYLTEVNENHLHDMGKWIFAISFLWTYLWFSQFMLIWYSDIPEEVTYFLVRIEGQYTIPYIGMILGNFIVPMLLLMSKDAKRNAGLLAVVCVIIFLGHWVDVYFLVVPGTMQDAGTFGWIEIGMFLLYLGIFLFVVFTQLAKAPLVVKQNALLDESLHHHIN